MKNNPTGAFSFRRCIRRRQILLTLVSVVLLSATAFVSSRQVQMQDSSDDTSNDQIQSPNAGWTVTGNLIAARSGHTATLLQNGKVLVAGGKISTSSGIVTATAEVYDPASGTWASTGNLNTARSRPTATLLSNGKVVVVGGFNGTASTKSVEIYDPTTGSWTAGGSLIIAREGHTVSLLPNGKLLVAGGVDGGRSADRKLESYG